MTHETALLPDAFLVRVLRADGEIAGIGTLVGERRIVTCVHVVNAAPGLSPLGQPRPDGTVLVTSRSRRRGRRRLERALSRGCRRLGPALPVTTSPDCCLPRIPLMGRPPRSSGCSRRGQGRRGSPVFDDALRRVVGMIAEAPPGTAPELCRFEAGELDPYVPGIERLPPEAPILAAQ
jgi:hypothetical protein